MVCGVFLSLGAYLVAREYLPSSVLRPVVLELLLVLTVIISVHLLERLFLWRTIRAFLAGAVRAAVKNATELAKAADQSGLVAIYPDRKSAEHDVRQALDTAKKRIWLLGVAFSQVITIDRLLANLEEIPEEKRPELHVLLLDALRSPALFRIFLESPLTMLKTILEADRNQTLPRDPICITSLYDQCQHASNSFSLNDSFRDSVKFYAHSPMCWMVIADDVCFYEPYTFGRPGRAQGSIGIGMYMPVFKFRRTEQPKTFDILEDHFQKLWLTTDVQQLGFGARLADTQRLTKHILDQRHSWFRRVYEALERNSAGKPERRHSPRSPCESDPKTRVPLEWKMDGTEHSNMATVIDFSSGGLGVELEDRNQLPPVGSTAFLVPSTSVRGNYSRHLLEYFRGLPLQTVRVAPETGFVGLRCLADATTIAAALVNAPLASRTSTSGAPLTEGEAGGVL